MRRRYATADVFTERLFGGNPVAVVLDAQGLSPAQMQALAAEFNYVETTFVLPPQDPAHTARVRIFTPEREVPFAGHPNIGTAFVLAHAMLARGVALPQGFVFEEAAGLVPVTLLREGNAVVGAELTTPQPLTRGATMPVGDAAACLSLAPEDIRTDAHAPQVASMGLAFLVVELATREALHRARPDRGAYDRLLPLDGASSVYAYTREVGHEAAGIDMQARMFTRRMVEDPATGSATAAMTALVAAVRGVPEIALRVGQGVDMGRPSLLLTRLVGEADAARVRVAGRCVAAFEGSFTLAGEAPAGA